MTIPTPERDKDESQDALVETPFAKVNSVTDGSPAHQAGLKAGDGIRAFGHVNWMNHENLTKVAEVVQRNEGVRFLLFCKAHMLIAVCTARHYGQGCTEKQFELSF